MIRLAFSTVACPDMTLDAVAASAASWGYQGVELRTFGDDSRHVACDPALTGAAKLRSLLSSGGVELAGLATGLRFDEPVTPPVIGHLFGGDERAVDAARRAIDIAIAIEAPCVRVFGFEAPDGARRAALLRRVVRRLAKVVDHADRTGVRIALENGGAFPRAADLAEIFDDVDSSLLGASYNVAVAHAAGEQPTDGLNVLAERLLITRLKDVRDGHPCAPGDGKVPCQDAVRALAAAGFPGWIVYEWDRLWVHDLAPAGEALPAAAERIFAWAAPAPMAAGAAR